MAEQTEAERNEEIELFVHRFSREAFELARAFVTGDASEGLKRQAVELKTRLPEVVARAREASEAYRPDLNLALSEANLDVEYVLAGGDRPSSIRLGHLIGELDAER